MITLTKNENTIVFTFEDNDHYLQDGTIEVPVNSLTLVTDNSQMANFKKSASNDIFISATYAELGMSKSELESWFKENACGSTGGCDIPSNLSEWTYDDNGNITSMVYTAETISDNAFSNAKLTSVTISNSVTSIGNNAFAYCSSLPNIDIPNSVTSIGEEAFRNCTGLTSITIPSGVTIIDNYIFYQCNYLTSVTIGNSVTSIGRSAFGNCYGLTRLNSDVDGVFNLPSGVTSISSAAFSNCYGLTSITIPSGVTSIDSNVFNNCRSLTSIAIPDSVTSIGASAFNGCSGLTSITINATTPPTLANTNAFNNTNNCPIYVPTESVDAYKSASVWRNYASRIQAIP